MGYDISWPQCGSDLPAPAFGFSSVGVNNGHLFSINPCLAQQWSWARGHGYASLHVNTNAPSAGELQTFLATGAQGCHGDTGCALFQWGHQGLVQSIADAHGVDAPFWWLDVETGNVWLPDTNANATVLMGMVAALTEAGKHVGVWWSC